MKSSKKANSSKSKFFAVERIDKDQWFSYICPNCDKNIWHFYGDLNDETYPDWDGIICCYCDAKIIFDMDLFLMESGRVFDTIVERDAYLEKYSSLDRSYINMNFCSPKQK